MSAAKIDRLPVAQMGPEDVPQPPNPALHGLRLFVVEDEALVALLLESMLDAHGCIIVGQAAAVKSALEAVARLGRGVDVAILDVNLGGERVFPVADALMENGIPFVFTTGYGPLGLEDRYPGRTVITKPYREAVLVEAVLDARRDSLH
ncbi:response regulator [Rhizorhapis sp. SPR117]|uniref:response regulator n=1 Tax=Rhizorhapis sp. SPR117 TaxID=2912611 RepID=UPI001F3A5A14|nr:response regulator [Rhizorhapis sp. SPR117]